MGFDQGPTPAGVLDLTTVPVKFPGGLVKTGWINVADYGANGDGTDQTTQMQNAANAVAALGGGVLFFPPGVYGFTTQITLSSNMVVLGSGWNTIIKMLGTTTLKQPALFGQYLSNVSVYNITFQGNNVVDQVPVAYTAAPITLPARGATGIVVPLDRVPTGVALNDVVHIIGNGLYLKLQVTAGIGTSTYTGTVNDRSTANGTIATNSQVSDPQANVQGLGGAWLSCSNIQYSYCRFYQMQGFALYFDALPGTPCTDIGVDHCLFDTSGQNRQSPLFMPAIFFGSSNNLNTLRAKVTNSWFKNLHWIGIWAGTRDGLYDNCHFENVGESRIAVGPQNIVSNCTDNRGYTADQSGWFCECYADDIIIKGNRVFNIGNGANPWNKSGTNCGIFLGGGRTVCSDNLFVNCQDGGIVLASTNPTNTPKTGTGIVIANNVVRDCGLQTTSGQTGGLLLEALGGPQFSDLVVQGNVFSGNFPTQINPVAAYDRNSCSFVGNSCDPDTIGDMGPDVLGSTAAFTLIAGVPLRSGVLGLVGGFLSKLRGRLVLTGTANFLVGFGGGGLLTLGGTWATGDVVSYTLNGVTASFTVGAQTDLASVTSGLVSAINAHATIGTQVTAATTILPGQITLTAKDAAFTIGSTLAHSSAKTSAAGTTGASAANLLVNVFNFTTAAGLVVPYMLDVAGMAHNGTTISVHAALLTGTTIAGMASNPYLAIDFLQPQALNYYVKQSNASDNVAGNILHYEKVG